MVAKRLDVARNSLSPQTGGSVYRFNQQSIHDLPQGSNTPLNQVLLQAPGVAQDSFGQIHVRGEHADLQYRINGVQLPEGITGFGQVLSPRFAQSLNFLTGALPAEYGYRTAGVVDIHSKSGLSLNGGDLDMYGGQHTTLQPSFELGGSKDKLDYFFSGQYLQTQLGVEPPTPGPSAYHDQTYQGQAFSYLSYFLSPTTAFEPDQRLRAQSLPDSRQSQSAAGLPACGRAILSLGQHQREPAGAELLRRPVLQGTIGARFDYQLSAFSRYSTLSFYPDEIRRPDLQRRRLADFPQQLVQRSARRQQLSPQRTHTMQSRFLVQRRAGGNRQSRDWSFPPTLTGARPANTPLPPIVDDRAITAWLYGVYIQDEWRPTRADHDQLWRAFRPL